MKKIAKIMMLSLVITLGLCSFTYVSASNPAKPNAVVVPCKNGNTSVSTIHKNRTSIYRRLRIFAAPGVTLSVTETHETTINNDINLSLIPELLSMGYQQSYTAGTSIGWSKKNTTSSPQELVILKVYDVINITKYSKYNNGYCTIGSSRNYNVAHGWAYDLR